MVNARRTGSLDLLLMLEGVLGLVLLALFVWHFWIPAAGGPFVPRWWAGVLLASLFFTILGLEALRRGRRQRDALRGALDEAKQRVEADDPPPPGS